MEIILTQPGPMLIAQVINLLLVIVLLALPFFIWARIVRWNRERNERLDRIASELRQIRESMAGKDR